MTDGTAAPEARRLRRALIARRAQLSRTEVSTASLAICARLWRLPVLARARRIACYFPVSGEVDCRAVVVDAWDRGREIFLPVLRDGALLFAPFGPNTLVQDNRFGIPEPLCHPRHLVAPHRLTVVLTPLVAFDQHGNRLGMGGGYYDRSFRFLTRRPRWARPRLIGLGYEFQKVKTLNAQTWDVPLHMTVTENRSYSF